MVSPVEQIEEYLGIDYIYAVRKSNVSQLVEPADFCLTYNGTILLRCPFCKSRMSLGTKPLSLDPLTLSTPVIGPKTLRETCGHRFRIESGKVKPGLHG